MQVDEIPKKSMERCPHVVSGKGCGIYEKRPGPCKSFECLWLAEILKSENGNDEDIRPDKLGIMFTVMYGTAFGDVITAWEVWPDASRETKGRILIEELARGFVDFVVAAQVAGVVVGEFELGSWGAGELRSNSLAPLLPCTLA